MTREEHLAEHFRQEQRILDELIDDLTHALTAAEELRQQPSGSGALWIRKRLWDEVGRLMDQAHRSWQVIKPDGGVLEYTTGRLIRLAAIAERKRER